MDIMTSLRQLIWFIGESKNGLTSNEIARKINSIELREETHNIKEGVHQVCSLVVRYRHFFLSEPVSNNPNAGNRYRLSKNGVKFYDNLVLTYDPITNKLILPQYMNIKSVEVS